MCMPVQDKQNNRSEQKEFLQLFCRGNRGKSYYIIYSIRGENVIVVQSEKLNHTNYFYAKIPFFNKTLYHFQNVFKTNGIVLKN